MKRRVLFVLPALLLGLGPVAQAQEAVMAGSWALKIVSPQGTRTPWMTLAQDGSVLSGTYKGVDGDLPISGSIHGTVFELVVKLQGEAATVVAEYRGTVRGDTLAGKVNLGKMGETDFTGARVK